MKSLLGHDIPENIRGILFICKFDGESIEVVRERMYNCPFKTVNAYANTPNPESHMVSGETHEEMLVELESLKNKFNTPKHIKGLKECL